VLDLLAIYSLRPLRASCRPSGVAFAVAAGLRGAGLPLGGSGMCWTEPDDQTERADVCWDCIKEPAENFFEWREMAWASAWEAACGPVMRRSEQQAREVAFSTGAAPLGNKPGDSWDANT